MFKITLAALFFLISGTTHLSLANPEGNKGETSQFERLKALLEKGDVTDPKVLEGEYTIKESSELLLHVYKGKTITEYVEEVTLENQSNKTKFRLKMDSPNRKFTISADGKFYEWTVKSYEPLILSLKGKELIFDGSESLDQAFRKLQVFMNKELSTGLLEPNPLWQFLVPSAEAFLDKQIFGFSLGSILLVLLGVSFIKGAFFDCPKYKEHSNNIKTASAAHGYPCTPFGTQEVQNMSTIWGFMGTSLMCSGEKNFVNDTARPLCPMGGTQGSHQECLGGVRNTFTGTCHQAADAARTQTVTPRVTAADEAAKKNQKRNPASQKMAPTKPATAR